ncbi:2-dehydropantoate 2-reductase N-terminal domain-containing protein [Roseomonas sp. CAU 1739]|uniref:2-dehydropantoate 2-reductase N-terminal domain-containing protein n=1 Tax=Roseomonas sp. CAU 1739 TaxID=3140364 RepID=UPI00325B2369
MPSADISRHVSPAVRGPLLAAIQSRGLTVNTPEGIMACQPHASANPGELGPQDAVMVPVNAPTLPAVAAGIAPLLRRDAAVILALNAVP